MTVTRLEDSGRATGSPPVAATSVDAALRYTEAPAPPQLRSGVAGIWWSSAGPAGHVQRLLPDGCVEVVVSPGRPPLVYGPRAGWFDLHVPQGEHRGVRLLPGAVAALLDVDAVELAGRVVHLEALHRPVGPDWSADDQLAQLLRDLTRRAGRVVEGDAVQHAVALMHDRPGIPVSAAARQVGLSERQLRRRFTAAVGLPPGTYRRIARVNTTLRAAAGRSAAPWARLAHECGYADQAHLARELRALTGSTPSQLRREGRRDTR